MEGGGIDLEPYAQALYEGEVVGLDYYPLEDARLRMWLLLASNSQLPAGIGNQNDSVGRFFSEHLQVLLGQAYFDRPIPAAASRPNPRPSTFRPKPSWWSTRSSASASGRAADRAAAFLPSEIVRSAGCAIPFAERLAQAVLGRAAYCDRRGGSRCTSPRTAAPSGAGAGLRDRRAVAGPREPGHALGPHESAPRLRPLHGGRDALGMPCIRLNWQVGALDYRMLETAAAEFGAHHAEQDIGRLRLAD